MRRTLFAFGRFVHDKLPCAGGDLRIACGQISTGNLQIDNGLLMRLVLGVENPQSSFFVPRFETFLFAGRVVLNEKNSAVPSKEAVLSFHRHLKDAGVEEFTLAACGQFSQLGA